MKTSRFPFETEPSRGFFALPFEERPRKDGLGKTKKRHPGEAFRVEAPLAGDGAGWAVVLSLDLDGEVRHARLVEHHMVKDKDRPALDFAFWKRIPIDDILRYALGRLHPDRKRGMIFVDDFDPDEIRFSDPQDSRRRGRPDLNPMWLARAANLYVNWPEHTEITVPQWANRLGVSAPRGYAIRTQLYDENYLIDAKRGGHKIPELTDHAWHLLDDGKDD